MVSDIVLTRPASKQEVKDMALLTGCISGSLPAKDYLAKIRAAGFKGVRLDTEGPAAEGGFWFSATIRTAKP